MKEVIKKGDKFGKLTAIKFEYKDRKSKQYWLFKCECGNEKTICVNNVKSSQIKSCGCIKKEQNFKHGMWGTKIYYSWRAMKARCSNKNHKEYENYGGRGITVCDRWLKFENFCCDIGEKPINKTLDRIDNDGNYCKDNCRWATPIEQANNTRRNHFLTFDGKTQTIAQWSRELNITRRIITRRLKRGWKIKRVLAPSTNKLS